MEVIWRPRCKLVFFRFRFLRRQRQWRGSRLRLLAAEPAPQRGNSTFTLGRFARGRSQRFQYLLRIDRFADQEALHEIALQRGEVMHLRLSLDALADHLQAEVMGEQNDRIKHHRTALVLETRQKERAVHLQRIERKPAQIGQRRIPCAEVVARQAQTQRLETFEDLQRQLRVFHHHGFGELELERAGHKFLARKDGAGHM